MNEQKRSIEAVIFDLDDTLLDWSQPELEWHEFTRPMADNVYDHLVAEGHSPGDRDRFFQLLREQVREEWERAKEDWSGANFGEALQKACQEAGADMERLDLEETMRAYDWRPMPGVDLYDDARAVLDELRERGYQIGLITNSFLPMWMRDVELEHYGLIHYFDARLTSGDAGYMKPHPAIYEQMLELLAVPAERAVFVGDRPQNDIAGANEAGLISILIDPSHLDRELNGIIPDYTITRLSELLPILEKLEREEETKATAFTAEGGENG